MSFWDFRILIFTVCDVTADPLPIWSKCSQMKLSQMAANPRKMLKFNPTKVKVYIQYVYLSIWLNVSVQPRIMGILITLPCL